MLSLSDECVLRGVREAFLPAHLHFLRSLTDVQSRQELQNQTPDMETRLRCVCVLALVILKGVSAVKVQNKLLGTCLQSHTGRVSLAECTPHSVGQEWNWFPEQQALVSQQNEECLTAPGGQYEGVQLKPCVFRAGADTNGAAEEMEGLESQMWSCSKKGHLTLISSRLHLSASSQSTLVFLSREHKHGSKWRALDNQTLCSKRESMHHSSPLQPEGKPLEPRTYLSSASDVNKQAGSSMMGAAVTDTNHLSPSIKTTADPTMVFFSMDYGMGWKVTMLILSSLALVLGTVILILNVYSNRRRKVVCVLKSYTPRPDASVPGSPVPSERAPLTEHAMRLPLSSPALQRGEILIEWKDGSVTPLYEA